MDGSKKDFEELRRQARESAATRWSRKELAQIALLKDAHQETIAPLLRDAPVKVLASGDVLLRAGEPCQQLYFVLSGRLKVAEPTSAPGPSVRAGDCIGELFLLGNTATQTTISALEPTRLLVIDRDTAWSLIRASHAIARNWLALFAQRSGVRGLIEGGEILKTSHANDKSDSGDLPGKTALESTLSLDIVRANASRTPLALLLLEIDSFESFVAKSGHAAGEDTYRAVAEILRRNVRPSDTITNYDTAQFAVVLPNSDINSACVVGERVRQAIRNSRIAGSENDGALTVSIGATQLQSFNDAATILSAAEKALAMAKSAGGDRIGMQ